MFYDIPLLAVGRRRESDMKRRELREHIFELLFRIEFNSSQEMPEQIRLFFEGLEELEEQDQSYMEAHCGEAS